LWASSREYIIFTSTVELLLATRNRHKVGELSALLRAAVPALRVRSMDDYPALPEVVEDGATLEENARKKALSAALGAGLPSLADDTGLEVFRLDGAPGVYSARWAGEGCTYDDNNAKLLRELRGAAPAERGACFRCVVCLAFPDGTTHLDEGRLDGTIADAPRGQRGFGYDPLFLLTGGERTLAELSEEEKNRVSHRARALEAAVRRLRTFAAEGRP
jgi:XTP/dITP diphosphohydrolase